MYFTCGKGGSKAAEGAKDAAEKAKEALVDTKKYFDTSIDDFKKAGNTFKNGKAVTPDGKDFEGTVGRLTGKTETGVDCYSKSTYKNGVRETLERYEGDKLVSSVKYEYDQATGKVAKIIETDAATGNQVNKAFEYDQDGNMSKILKTDKDGKDLGSSLMHFANDGKWMGRSDFDNGGILLNSCGFGGDGRFWHGVRDGKSFWGPDALMYSAKPQGAVTEHTVYKNGKEVKLFERYEQGNKIFVKQGENIVTTHSKSVDGKDVLTRNELSSPVKDIDDVKNMSYASIDPNSVQVKKWENRCLETQVGSRDRVLYDTSKGTKTEIASSKGGKIFKDGAEFDTVFLKAKIGDTEITSDSLVNYTIGTETYSRYGDKLYDSNKAVVTDQNVLSKINQFDKQFEWIKELSF